MRKLCTRAAAILLLAGGAASCGAAPAPSAPRLVESVATPDSALRALDEAEAELARVLGGAPALQMGQAVAPASPHAEPPPPPPQQHAPPGDAPAHPSAAPRDHHQPGRGAAARPLSSDPCVTACTALASMERAADHLCGLAGAGDDRCQRARDRVKSASVRVFAACPTCGR